MIAHRGVYGKDKENTLKGFERACKHMDGFECDVRLSLDEKPVVIHDATLSRTHSLPYKVEGLYEHELSNLGVA